VTRQRQARAKVPPASKGPPSHANRHQARVKVPPANQRPARMTPTVTLAGLSSQSTDREARAKVLPASEGPPRTPRPRSATRNGGQAARQARAKVPPASKSPLQVGISTPQPPRLRARLTVSHQARAKVPPASQGPPCESRSPLRAKVPPQARRAVSSATTVALTPCGARKGPPCESRSPLDVGVQRARPAAPALARRRHSLARAKVPPASTGPPSRARRLTRPAGASRGPPCD
jgi:hypothetical protein